MSFEAERARLARRRRELDEEEAELAAREAQTARPGAVQTPPQQSSQQRASTAQPSGTAGFLPFGPQMTRKGVGGAGRGAGNGAAAHIQQLGPIDALTAASLPVPRVTPAPSSVATTDGHRPIKRRRESNPLQQPQEVHPRRHIPFPVPAEPAAAAAAGVPSPSPTRAARKLARLQALEQKQRELQHEEESIQVNVLRQLPHA